MLTLRHTSDSPKLHRKVAFIRHVLTAKTRQLQIGHLSHLSSHTGGGTSCQAYCCETNRLLDTTVDSYIIFLFHLDFTPQNSNLYPKFQVASAVPSFALARAISQSHALGTHPFCLCPVQALPESETSTGTHADHTRYH